MSDGALRQCMGGWCRLRDRCEYYTAPPAPGLDPSERLCETGHDEPLRARLASQPLVAQWVAGADGVA